MSRHNQFLHAALIFALTILAGCDSLFPPPLTPQTKARISQIAQDSAVAKATATSKGDVALAQQKARAVVNAAKGHDTPVLHPLAAANNLVVELRPWLIAITVASSLLWAIQFGLSFTAFSFLNFLAPVFRWVSILSIAALIALPFLPWAFLIVGVALIGLIVYELVKDRGNVPAAIADAETLIGLHTSTGSVQAPIRVTLGPGIMPAPTPGLTIPPAALRAAGAD